MAHVFKEGDRVRFKSASEYTNGTGKHRGMLPEYTVVSAEIEWKCPVDGTIQGVALHDGTHVYNTRLELLNA